MQISYLPSQRPEPRSRHPWSGRELGLVGAFAALLLLAMVLPPLHWAGAAAQHFADTRTWLGVPNGLDVLSNLPFAVWGAWGLGALLAVWRREASCLAWQGVAGLFFVGLLATAWCSSLYHLRLDDVGLLWDRLGMTVAFAGLIGVAVCERVAPRMAVASAAALLLGGAAGAWSLYASGNALPWGLVQFGGMVLVAALAFAKPLQAGPRVDLFVVIACYALAKAFEHFDAEVLQATAGLVSGHTLKHLVAACAAWPVVAVLMHNRSRQFNKDAAPAAATHRAA